MRITHPIEGYTGPVSVGRRIWFLAGVAEATYLRTRHRRALEDAGFEVVNPRAEDAEDDDAGGVDSPPAE